MSLTTSLSIASQSLLADDGALQATNNNIANANTPGYSRQQIVFQEAAPVDEGTVSQGNGVVLEGFRSVRDELLQTQIEQQTQAQGGVTAQLNNLQQIQPVFTTSTNDIGTEMSSLFSSISSLSTDPTSSSQRQDVLSSAQDLATAFNTASSALTTQQTGLNSQVTQDVTQINQLTSQIAALNPKITALEQSGQDGGSVQDQQDQLVLTLSQLTSVSATQTADGITLATGNGTPLVVGAQSFALNTSTGSSGLTQVLDQEGSNITSSLSSGDLGGTVQVQNQVIPGLLTQLDTLAHQVGNAFNAAQAQGYDQSGNVGGNLFSLSPSVAGAAASIRVAISSASGIAVSSDGTAGSNGNVANLSAIQAAPLPGGSTPTATYANLVYQVGSLTSSATAESSALSASLVQLNSQRSSISGVSIDQESTNLIQFQQSYEAAAQVVTTIQTLFQATMAMLT